MSEIRSARQARKLRALAQAYLRVREGAIKSQVRARYGQGGNAYTLAFAAEDVTLPDVEKRCWVPARRIVERKMAQL